MFRDRPARYFQVLHAVCSQSNTALKLEKHRLQNPSSPDSTQIKVNQAPASDRPPLPPPPTHAPPPNARLDSSQIKVIQAPATSVARPGSSSIAGERSIIDLLSTVCLR
jgi:hypothetical protein